MFSKSFHIFLLQLEDNSNMLSSYKLFFFSHSYLLYHVSWGIVITKFSSAVTKFFCIIISIETWVLSNQSLSLQLSLSSFATNSYSINICKLLCFWFRIITFILSFLYAKIQRAMVRKFKLFNLNNVFSRLKVTCSWIPTS